MQQIETIQEERIIWCCDPSAGSDSLEQAVNQRRLIMEMLVYQGLTVQDYDELAYCIRRSWS